jgi:hypothetical protein
MVPNGGEKWGGNTLDQDRARDVKLGRLSNQHACRS